ncbi:unnamed protein product [Allacma fusca]|uniref:Uncharacterized protein n=1 Tax=Allacma fusca TaxID=39272 RepID=A0A8J2K3X3_9HEXA|nr:unnamed protein product [Allacma fusca]
MFLRNCIIISIFVLNSCQFVLANNELRPSKELNNSHSGEWAPSEKFKKDFPCYLSGYDYYNRPVLVVPAGKWDTRRIAKEGGQDLEDFLRRNDLFIQRVNKGYYRRRVDKSPIPKEPATCHEIFREAGVLL